ncbi:MAG TPA: rhodanese-like domain-containing protein [Desulfonatronum sp.]|nr:rhodanese-like domain-containing protein [Desulfonatronum sp.]
MNRKTLIGCILLLIWLAGVTMSCATLSGQNATPPETTPDLKLSTTQVPPGREPGTVDEKWFAEMMGDLPSDVHLVDVRSKWAFAKAHLPKSMNMPRKDFYSQGCEAYIAKLPQHGTIIFICTAGNYSRSVYSSIRDRCRYQEIHRVFFLNARIDYENGTLNIPE